MHSTFLLAFIVLLTASIPAQAAAPNEQPFFPIMAWTIAPTDAPALKQIRDCGITIAGLAPASALDAVHAAGLKVIVQDPRTGDYDWQNVDEAAAKKNVTSLLNETAKHPAVFGYYLRDEPHSVMFPGLAKVIASVRSTQSEKIPFINLFPNYASPDQLGNKTYDEHLEQFITTCKPSIISYDNYSLMDDGSLRDGYYQNLESVRRATLKHNLPFWNCVLAVGHFSYRVPSLPDFAFQAYTTLAYGGRGIVYFTYMTPHVGNYRMSPIDQFGNVTPTYWAMQNVNLQVLKLAPTILKMKFDDVYHVGTVPHDCHGPGATNLIKSVAGSDFLVGDFTHEDGSRYVMVVNKDVNKSHPCQVTYTKPPKSVQLVSPYSGTLTDFAGEQGWLAPGSGALLRLQF